MSGIMNIVELEKINKIYDDLHILKDINLKVKKGTSTSLVGPTGSGKTVLLKLIDLLEKPSSGTFLFESVDANESSSRRLDIRRQIGMVFQKPLAFKTTVYENVAYGLKIRGDNQNLKVRVKDILEMVDLKGYDNRNALKLSGGETQRLALARAMITDPKLLLLDEPTANLDPISTNKMEDLITRINYESETTIIMTTHNLSQGQKLTDRMVILYNGYILQDGTPEEIFAKPNNKFVADFIGIPNLMSGKIEGEGELKSIDTGLIKVYTLTEKTGNVNFTVRPDEITVSNKYVLSSARNIIQGKVREINDTGFLIKLTIDAGELFTVFITRESLEELQIFPESQVWINFKVSAVHIF